MFFLAPAMFAGCGTYGQRQARAGRACGDKVERAFVFGGEIVVDFKRIIFERIIGTTAVATLVFQALPM